MRAALFSLKHVFQVTVTQVNMEEELIEAVQREQCLYDVKHPDYVKVKLKDSIWKRIAKELNLGDGNEAKRTWEKLRNNHRNSLRRQKKGKRKSGSASLNIRSWRFQEIMSFLIPHMAKRYKTNEVEYDESPQENDTQESLPDTNHSSESPPTDVSNYQVNKRRRHKRDSLDYLVNRRSIEEHQQQVLNRQRKRECLITNTSNDFTLNNVKHDSLFHFFMSMYKTTKTLPLVSQHTIKTNICIFVSVTGRIKKQHSVRLVHILAIHRFVIQEQYSHLLNLFQQRCS